jgi:hypothetical protein
MLSCLPQAWSTAWPCLASGHQRLHAWPAWSYYCYYCHTRPGRGLRGLAASAATWPLSLPLACRYSPGLVSGSYALPAAPTGSSMAPYRAPYRPSLHSRFPRGSLLALVSVCRVTHLLYLMRFIMIYYIEMTYLYLLYLLYLFYI